MCCHVRGVPVASAASTQTPTGVEMEWVLDLASDVHVCKESSVLNNVRVDIVHFFQGYDGKESEDEQVGDLTLRVKNNKPTHAELMLPLKNVLLSQSAPDNLLSMDMLESDRWTVKFDWINPQSVCWLRKDCMELLLVKSNRRYRLKATAVAIYRVSSLQAGEQCSQSDSEKIVLRKRTRAASLERWHLRYAHLNFATLQQMARRGIAVDMEDELCEDMDSPCWTCKASKMTRMSYKKTVPRRATRPYQKLMSDMCYVGVVAYDGYEHFQLVHDEASRFIWGFLMRRKQDATEVVMAHLKWLIAQGHRIEVFCSDQGRELLNRSMKAFLEATGIEFI
ncbi:hypothetical protein PC116_g10804 [Phytophthora cactorum]|uniref:Integrase catalytic domain-containing protein n=2 Tax=Phytophthora cactorum TaxID=29920 RepID=A0A8T1KY75_9STRA|nr:hypothetical protein Pcac1_g22756 [Phytophthora cactorum]KAG2826244.1 hypothetical protein PC112_g9355 [Phytophthora cactorum]KAG2835050.1 hypothetical protein PC111_g5585 [Phytophthora cactorum]KAG2944409.1 hypothetical protein PC117_g9028 [Phytophthora cactorum]KAG2985524.1 hypothetical protein PC118_g8276 [Phytophthora cactorum]